MNCYCHQLILGECVLIDDNRFLLIYVDQNEQANTNELDLLVNNFVLVIDKNDLFDFVQSGKSPNLELLNIAMINILNSKFALRKNLIG